MGFSVFSSFGESKLCLFPRTSAPAKLLNGSVLFTFIVCLQLPEHADSLLESTIQAEIIIRFFYSFRPSAF